MNPAPFVVTAPPVLQIISEKIDTNPTGRSVSKYRRGEDGAKLEPICSSMPQTVAWTVQCPGHTLCQKGIAPSCRTVFTRSSSKLSTAPPLPELGCTETTEQKTRKSLLVW